MSVTAVPLQPVKSSYKAWLWFGLVLAVALAFGLAWMGTREQALVHAAASGEADTKFLAWHKSQPGVETTKSGLQYQLIRAGRGPKVTDGDGVILNIEGRFRDGTVFQAKGPDQWLVDAQGRIPGYAEGVKLMNKGSVYRLWIPASLGYGATPQDPRMRKDAMLIFDVEVIEHLTADEIQAMREAQMRQMQQQQQMAPPPEGGAPGGAPAPQGGAPRQ